MQLSPTKIRVGLASGLVAGALGLAIFTGLGPAPALSSVASHGAEGGDRSGTTGTTVGTTVATPAPAAAGSRVIDAAGAGTVTVHQAGGRLSLVSAVPATGWMVEVEQAAGREIELDFRRGGQRVQVNVEIEDGVVRERLRVRDDEAGTDLRIENGVVVRAEGFGDQSIPAPSTGSGGPSGDGSGRGGDDGPGDDHGGDRDGDGGGSGRGGGDDGPGDDHGGDD
jgi:hypothetical protein